LGSALSRASKRLDAIETVAEGGSDAEIRALLAECFGLDEAVAATAVASLRERYPR
jgi:hypothetical protein